MPKSVAELTRTASLEDWYAQQDPDTWQKNTEMAQAGIVWTPAGKSTEWANAIARLVQS